MSDIVDSHEISTEYCGLCAKDTRHVDGKCIEHKLKPGQVYDNGKITLIGKYTVAIRNAYMYYRVERYLIDHPEATRKQAGQIARHAWRQKAKASMNPNAKGFGQISNITITPKEPETRIVFIDRPGGMRA